MTFIDVLIVLLLLFGAYRGYAKGGVVTTFKLCGFLVGLLVAYLLNEQLGYEMAPRINTNVTTARVICFFLMWIVIPFGMIVVGHMFTHVIEAVKLGIVNRVIGAVLGVAIYFMATSCCIGFLSYTRVGAEQLKDSKMAVHMLAFSRKFIDAVPPEFREKVEDGISKHIRNRAGEELRNRAEEEARKL